MNHFRGTLINRKRYATLKEPCYTLLSGIFLLVLFITGFCLKLLFDALHHRINTVVFFNMHYAIILYTFMYLHFIDTFITDTFMYLYMYLYQKQLQKMFCKKRCSQNFAKFTGRHQCQGLFFNKVAGIRPPTLFKKGALTQVISGEFFEVSKNTSKNQLLFDQR